MADIFVATTQNVEKEVKRFHEPHMNVLSSFCQSPKGLSFQTQKEKETIVLFLRPHPLTNLSWILFSAFLLFLPLIITIFLPMFGINFLSSSIINHFTAIYVLFYYLILSSYVLISFLTWFYNIFIVTTDRIVDINYTDIVIHNVSETKLNHIEDVKFTQSGFIPTLFNYGNLNAQTAGEMVNFEARSIPRPKETADIITNLIKN
ncbi:MAG: hypothetical protein HW400_467 [Candidatus Levybacteria bacterium]|nr:hypothetical protein [Candidatus Levybacteria bacterium]